MRIWIIGCLFIFVSCQKTPHRIPASIESNNDLLTVVESLGEAVKNPVANSTSCYQDLNEYYKKLFGMTSKNVSIDTISSGELKKLIRTSFETRLLIKEKMKRLRVVNEADQSCLHSIRNINRALRYVEDYLTEIAINKDKNLKEKYESITGDSPYFLVNSNFEFRDHNDLRSGDVILSRGNAYSSAAIARIGTTDAQFSHLSLVYEDEEKKLHTVEAHIEIGNVVAPIQVHLDQGNSREVVFRFKDPVLAHEAAKYMYEKVAKAQKKKKNIRYDFGMDYKDNSTLFCSEVIYDGFNKASGGALDIPMYKTKFSRNMIPFLSNIGINVTEENVDTFETFSPGDIEFDPRFDMVAEWRNPKKISDSRIKDMVLTKLFDWMETELYKFKPRFGIKAQSMVGWTMRRVPWINSAMGLKEQFPLNMGRGPIKLFVVLDEVGEVLYEEILKAQKESKGPLAPIEMFKILDDFKDHDLITYLAKKRKSKIHRQFRQPKSSLKRIKKERKDEISARKKELKR